MGILQIPLEQYSLHSNGLKYKINKVKNAFMEHRANQLVAVLVHGVP